jgi:hypothetical protein
MKVFQKNSFRVYFLFPKITDYYEDLFAGGRKGKQLQANTGFVRVYKNEERCNWFEITILGFGLGFAWGEEGWSLDIGEGQ